jgi:hypothetical protein
MVHQYEHITYQNKRILFHITKNGQNCFSFLKRFYRYDNEGNKILVEYCPTCGEKSESKIN